MGKPTKRARRSKHVVRKKKIKIELKIFEICLKYRFEEKKGATMINRKKGVIIWYFWCDLTKTKRQSEFMVTIEFLLVASELKNLPRSVPCPAWELLVGWDVPPPWTLIGTLSRQRIIKIGETGMNILLWIYLIEGLALNENMLSFFKFTLFY